MKSRSEIEAETVETIRDFLDTHADKVRLDLALLDDLGIDSLEAIEAGIHIEDHFEISIADEVMESWVTVQDVANSVYAILNP